jgi:hypothetical protein
LGSYDVGRLQVENLRETFQEEFNNKPVILKFYRVKDGWKNFRIILCQFADSILGKKISNVARNITENSFCLIERRRSLNMKYLSDR